MEDLFIKSKHRKRKGKKELLFIWGMLALPLVQWLIFWLGINVDFIRLAFLDARTDAVTFSNFVTFWDELTSPYGSIKVAFINTLKYFATTMLIINPLSLIVAYFIYKRIWGYKIFRIVFYLPAIISSVVMVESFRQIIRPEGIVDAFLHLFGGSIPPVGWPDYATNTILFYTVWTGFGGNMLLFMGAMIRVPTEMLEASKLDGCSALREFFVMIIPMIVPTIATLVVISCTNIISSTAPSCCLPTATIVPQRYRFGSLRKYTAAYRAACHLTTILFPARACALRSSVCRLFCLSVTLWIKFPWWNIDKGVIRKCSKERSAPY